MLKSGQPIQTTGNNLVGLWRPSFVKVDHRLIVYGGGGVVTNDLHVLNLCDMRWETIQVGTIRTIYQTTVSPPKIMFFLKKTRG